MVLEHSSIFYLNSLFYLPYIKYYFFNIGAVMIMGFSLLSFINLIKNEIKLKMINSHYIYHCFL